MDVLFLIEAGGKYGLGHLMRCAVLARECRSRGAVPKLALRRDGELPDWQLPFESYGSIANGPLSAASIQAMAAELKPAWVVVDGYGLFADDLMKRLRANGQRVAAFTDTETDIANANVVINQNLARPSEIAGRLLGPTYALVDPIYIEYRGRHVSDHIGRVLVTFGGSDLHGMTGHVLATLSTIDESFDIDVVVGPQHRVRDFPQAGQHRMKVHEQPHGLAPLIQAADLMISAAGSTCWQACCIGVPLIAIQTVDNQVELLRCLEETCCALTMRRNPFARAGRDVALLSLVERLQDYRRRAEMVAMQRRLVDGEGAARIADAMGL